MPTKCIAAGCDNTHKQNVSLYKFPTDSYYRRAWTRNVKLHRADWGGPTGSSVLCSVHFKDDQFDPSRDRKIRSGYATGRRLKPTAIPSVFPTKSATCTDTEPVTASTESTTTDTHVLHDTANIANASTPDTGAIPVILPQTSTCSTATDTGPGTSTTLFTHTQDAANASTPAAVALSTPDGHSHQLHSTPDTGTNISSTGPPPKKRKFDEMETPRSAFLKRESQRVLAQVFEEYEKKKAGIQDQAEVHFEADDQNVLFVKVPSAISTPTQCGVPAVEKPVVTKKSTKTSYVQTNRATTRCARVQVKVKMRTIGFQTEKETAKVMATTAVQTDDITDITCTCTLARTSTPQKKNCRPSNGVYPASPIYQEPDSPPENPANVTDKNDPDFNPGDEEESSYDESRTEEPKHQSSRKFLVFEENLVKLFKICPMCRTETSPEVKQVMGTMVSIEQLCPQCQFQRTWDSQPRIKHTPAGNLLLSSGILLAGASPSKILLVLRHMGVAASSYNTFLDHQRYYLQPAIEDFWTSQRKHLIDHLLELGKPLVLAGDGRADSPGHCAKYGCYSLLESSLNKVVDIELVQSNEVKGSYHMEKEGLVRAVSYLQANGLEIGKLITDRHRQIAKWIREELPSTTHLFDVWHVAKGIRTKLMALAKQSNCEIIGDWTQSLVNHLYWSASSTPEGQGDLLLAKWLSVLNHVQDIHEGHDDLFPECEHEPLEGEERLKAWIEPNTKASVKLEKLLSGTLLKNDIRKLSTEVQTSSLESFHSLINRFAPKQIHFSYHGMVCRLHLAALHFNENSGRLQKKTTTGKEMYGVRYPKWRKGGAVVTKIKTETTYEYVNHILELTIDRCRRGDKTPLPTMNVPRPLCQDFTERPSPAEAIKAHQTRFKLLEHICINDERRACIDIV